MMKTEEEIRRELINIAEQQKRSEYMGCGWNKLQQRGFALIWVLETKTKKGNRVEKLTLDELEKRILDCLW